MVKLAWFLLFLATLTVQTVSAQGKINRQSFPDQFVREALRIPQLLIAQGYQRFGALDLNVLMSKMKSVKIEPTTGWTVGDRNDNGRISARWEIRSGQRSISVDLDMWKGRPEQRPLLALHEVLGVFGFYDNHYWISIELWFLTLPESQTLLTSFERQKVANRIRELSGLQTAGGGVIGVGGGGEINTLYARMGAIRRTLEVLRKASTSAERAQALDQLSQQLESRMEVSYTHWTPERLARAARESKRKRPAECLMRGGLTCPLSPRTYGNHPPCHCPGHESEEGIVTFPESR